MASLILFVLSQVFLVVNSIRVPVVPENNDEVAHNLYLTRNTKVEYTPLQYASTGNLNYQPAYPQFFIYHPPISYEKDTDKYEPHSYQVINFAKTNEKIIQNPRKIHQPIIKHTKQPLKSQNTARNSKKSRSSKVEDTVKDQHQGSVEQELPSYGTKRTSTLNNKKHTEADKSNEESEEYHSPISEHELPREIPTKPIYPGPGQWAKYGIKHKPYIYNAQYTKPAEGDEDDERPEGYETFEKGQKQYDLAKAKFRHDVETFPHRHQFQPSKVNYETELEPLYDKPEIGFIPQKLYAQVRKTESEQHLPRSAIDPEVEENASRLREVIKDSKIHTIYTEEGYEDNAYDHAGHEKNAENSEGKAELENDQYKSTEGSRNADRAKYKNEGGQKRGKNSERRKIHDDEVTQNENYNESDKYRRRKNEAYDTDVAGSKHTATQINSKNNSTPSKNIRKVTLKNGQNIDVEIYTEVKFIPEAHLKKQKFVKIIPRLKISTADNSKLNSSDNKTKSNAYDNNANINIKNNNSKINISDNSKIKSGNIHLKRVKRYDKEMLSKRYIRKRPNYYWKKNKTTTEKNSFNSRKFRYEATTPRYSKLTTSVPEMIRVLTIATTSTTTSTPITTTTTVSKTKLSTPSEFEKKNITSSFRPRIYRKKIVIKRQKRFTIDYPKLEVSLDEFTDVRKVRLPTPKPDQNHLKYPYYKLPVSEHLNINSPLRYAENLNNVPIKKSHQMSFYESRKHIKCPEIERDVNPVPERISQREEPEMADQSEDLNIPRLKGLGDKIDCLKVKYFGENPLDSPFFREEIINPPRSLFPDDNITYKIRNSNPKYNEKNSRRNINKENAKWDYPKIKERKRKSVLASEYILENNRKSKTIHTDGVTIQPKASRKRELKIKILEPIVVIDDELFQSSTANPIHQKNKAVLQPPFTLMQMITKNKRNKSKYRPNSIYEKILYLESENEMEQKQSNVTEPEKFLIIYENQSDQEDDHFKNKLKNTSENNTENSTKLRGGNVPQAKNISTQRYIEANDTSLPVNVSEISSSTTVEHSGTPSTPRTPTPLSSSPLLMSNNLPKHNLVPKSGLTPFSFIFDISQYLPTTKILRPRSPDNTDINTEQQMMYFPNILEPRKEKQENEKLQDNSDVSTTLKPVVNDFSSSETRIFKTKYPQHQVSKRSVLAHSIHDDFGRRRILKSNHHGHVESNDDLIMDGTELIKTYVPYEKNAKNPIQHANKPEESDLMMEESENIPTYVSLSRKPKVYTEIVRARSVKQSNDEGEDEVEEEDLNPRKRIYRIKSPEEIESEKSYKSFPVETFVVDEATEPTTTSAPVIYPVEANPDNKFIAQYVFIIEKLHEKIAKENLTAASTAETVTADTITPAVQITSGNIKLPEGEPAFLQIINHLHEIRQEYDKNNPALHDEETSSTNEQIVQHVPSRGVNPTIPKVEPEIIRNTKERVDSDSLELKNSDRKRNMHVKFRTSINTAKYKTIDREPVSRRHNFSSRYNSADQELPLNKSLTTQRPLLSETPVTNTDRESQQIVTNRKIVPTTKLPTAEEVSTTPPSVRSRQRSRSRSRTPATTTATTTEYVDTVTTNPIFRRRRPNRISTSTTTETTTANHSRRKHRQQSDVQIRSDTQTFSSEHYQPRQRNITSSSIENPKTTTIIPNTTLSPDNKKRRTLQKVHERRVMSEVTLTRYYEPESEEAESLPNDSLEEIKNAEESKKHQYEVISPLTHIDTRHGGNYKHEKDAQEDEKKLSNEVNKRVPNLPEQFYNDSDLAVNINKLNENSKSSNVKNETDYNVDKVNEDTRNIEEKSTYNDGNVYPHMAQMVNRLAESQTEIPSPVEETEREEIVTTSRTYQNPNIIKDPSRRMYFYANV